MPIASYYINIIPCVRIKSSSNFQSMFHFFKDSHRKKLSILFMPTFQIYNINAATKLILISLFHKFETEKE